MDIMMAAIAGHGNNPVLASRGGMLFALFAGIAGMILLIVASRIISSPPNASSKTGNARSE